MSQKISWDFSNALGLWLQILIIMAQPDMDIYWWRTPVDQLLWLSKSCLRSALRNQNAWEWDYRGHSLGSTNLSALLSHAQVNSWRRISLVVQGLRIRLPMQGTRVRALVWEDPTCRGATKSVYHNYWACALEPVSHNYWAHMPQLRKPVSA